MSLNVRVLRMNVLPPDITSIETNHQRVNSMSINLTKHVFRSIGATACLILGTATSFGQQSQPTITGISHMCVYASDPAASDHFYAHILGASKGSDPQDPTGTRYYFSPTQFVEVLPLPETPSWSQKPMILRISACTSGFEVLRSGWNS